MLLTSTTLADHASCHRFRSRSTLVSCSPSRSWARRYFFYFRYLFLTVSLYYQCLSLSSSALTSGHAQVLFPISPTSLFESCLHFRLVFTPRSHSLTTSPPRTFCLPFPYVDIFPHSFRLERISTCLKLDTGSFVYEASDCILNIIVESLLLFARLLNSSDKYIQFQFGP